VPDGDEGERLGERVVGERHATPRGRARACGDAFDGRRRTRARALGVDWVLTNENHHIDARRRRSASDLGKSERANDWLTKASERTEIARHRAMMASPASERDALRGGERGRALRSSADACERGARASASVEVYDDITLRFADREVDGERGESRGWRRRGIAIAACCAGLALAIVSARVDSSTANARVSALGDFELRRGREGDAAALGERRKAVRTGTLGDEGDDDAPFEAVRGYFAYEKWFKSFENGKWKFPGDSARENDGKDGAEAIQTSANHGLSHGASWDRIREDVRASKGKKKILLFLRHGEATHNVWGSTIAADLKVLPCSFNNDGDLLDPSLTAEGVRQIVGAHASLAGNHGLLSAALGTNDDDDDDKDKAKSSLELRVLTSPLLRTIESAVIATNAIPQVTSSIVVTDYLRERLELNAPFEVRHPFSVSPGSSKGATSFIASTGESHCKFHEGLTELFPDELFKIHVEADKGCRVDETKPDSWKTCKNLALTHASDLDLGNLKSETMLGVMNRVKVVLANTFDRYDEDVVMLVTHSDWIIASLMELYPDTLGFIPLNGEIVPMVVEDKRHKGDDASSSKSSSRASVGDDSSAKKSTESKKSSGDSDDSKSKVAADAKSARTDKKKEASMGVSSELTERLLNSLRNVHEHFAHHAREA